MATKLIPKFSFDMNHLLGSTCWYYITDVLGEQELFNENEDGKT